MRSMEPNSVTPSPHFDGPSFVHRLRDMFEASPNEWIEAPLCMEVGGLAFNQRIQELRKAGMDIENKTERQPNGRTFSWYRYKREAVQEVLFQGARS